MTPKVRGALVRNEPLRALCERARVVAGTAGKYLDAELRNGIGQVVQ